jgi:D-amino peptidase
MKKALRLGMVVCALCLMAQAEPAEGLKVFISVDMEGISGVVTSEECSSSGRDYGLFRRIMTEDTNAAVEGACKAGATEVWVRDSHGSARNILPDLLDRRAIVVTDSTVNGVSLPEAGWNALIAGHYNVPVVFVSGDRAICGQVKDMFGEVETVAVKDAIGAAAVCLHPLEAQDKIGEGVEKALKQLDRYKPYKFSPPYTLVLKLKTEKQVYNGAFYPGAERTGDWELTFRSDDIMEIVKAFIWMRK